jgi:hypothetical protein
MTVDRSSAEGAPFHVNGVAETPVSVVYEARP